MVVEGAHPGSLWAHLLCAQIICSCKTMHGAPMGKVALLLSVQDAHLQLAACLLLLGKPCISFLLQTLHLSSIFHPRVPSKSRSPGAESTDAIRAHPGTDGDTFHSLRVSPWESRLQDC